jgi:DmsE family decaheme c-type cytochrome
MKRLLMGVAMIVLLPWFWAAISADAAGKDNQQAVASQEPAAVAVNGYVGSEVCATCHADIATKFSTTNPHAKLALEHGGKGVTCESCHGPGKAHVDSGGDATKIFQFSKATPKQVVEKCLACHAGEHPNFKRSPHSEAGLSCISCHSNHSFKAETFLLKASQPMLCYQCHGDVKGMFAMPFHHPVNEGAVTCSDCHDPHGTFRENNLKSTVDENLICTKCHAEMRGPFVYEHAPVKGEGCMGCHTPHGSQNARLLNMPQIATLCNQCHSPVAAGTFHSMGAGSSERTPCTNCHTWIHGSNLNQAFLK